MLVADPLGRSALVAVLEADVLVVTVKLDAGASWTLPRFAGTSPEKVHRNAYFHAGSGTCVVGGQRINRHMRITLSAGPSLVGGAADFDELVVERIPLDAAGISLADPEAVHAAYGLAWRNVTARRVKEAKHLTRRDTDKQINRQRDGQEEK